MWGGAFGRIRKEAEVGGTVCELHLQKFVQIFLFYKNGGNHIAELWNSLRSVNV